MNGCLVPLTDGDQIFKMERPYKSRQQLEQSHRHRGSRGGHAAPARPIFCVAKRKKGDKGKKERVSKQKLLKGCHQSQNIIALAILERLEFENFSCQPTMVTDNTFQCSMPPLPFSHFEIHFAGPVDCSLSINLEKTCLQSA